jgi:hypothetical protein
MSSGVESRRFSWYKRVTIWAFLKIARRKVMKRILIVALVIPIVLGLVFAASAGQKPNCHPGKTCKCIGTRDCNFICAEKDCKVETQGTGDTSVTCDKGGCEVVNMGTGDLKVKCKGGKCKVHSTGTGDVKFDCPGNDCKLTCTGTGDCKLTGCKKNCKLMCTGTGDCENDCKDPSCK